MIKNQWVLFYRKINCVSMYILGILYIYFRALNIYCVVFLIAMCEMMKIMQENREVTCCLGSSANFRNSRSFLQSDLRYTNTNQWLCVRIRTDSYADYSLNFNPPVSTALLWTLCIRLSVRGRHLATPLEEDSTLMLKVCLLWGSPDSSTAWAAQSPSTKERASAW